MNLSELHDATLQRLEILWNEGVLNVLLTKVADPPERLRLTLSGVTLCNVTRRFPWGESECLNEIDVTDTKGGKKLKIEMQSGDYIEVNFVSVCVFPGE